MTATYYGQNYDLRVQIKHPYNIFVLTRFVADMRKIQHDVVVVVSNSCALVHEPSRDLDGVSRVVR